MKTTLKKITASVMAVATLAVGTIGNYETFTFAANMEDEQANIEIVNLSSNISEDEIQKITDSVCAKLVCEDGSEVPVDTVVTIKDVSTSNSKTRTMSDNADSNSYQVTVLASSDQKIVSDSNDKNTSKVVASATLQMVWTDKTGTKNVLNTVSGTRTVKKGTVSKATLKYGNGERSSILWTKEDVTSKSSFSYSPNITVSDPSALYDISFEEGGISLYLSVSASIFQ